MIETRTDQILAMLRDGRILSGAAFQTADLFKALEIRETDMHRHFFSNELDTHYRILPIHKDIRGIVSDIHDESYAHSKNQIRLALANTNDYDSQILIEQLSTQIQQELVGIAKSRAVEGWQIQHNRNETPWHDLLWKSYAQNQIPMISAKPFVQAIIREQSAG